MSALPVTIRCPRDVEGPACRLLLPEIATDRGSIEVLVASQTAAPSLAGLVAYHRAPAAFYAVRIRVVRSVRRRGVGSALLQAVLEEAVSRCATAIHARWDEDPGPDAEAFLAHHGFAHHETLTTVEGPLDHLASPVLALRDRLQTHGRIPGEARIVPFTEAPADQVSRLYAEDVIHNPALGALLAAHLENASRLLPSPVLMIDDVVAGIMLFTMDGDVAHVQGRAVAPAFRGSWANAYLMAAAIERARDAGARRVRFEVPGGNRDTIKLARRAHATAVSTIHQWRLDLGNGGKP